MTARIADPGFYDIPAAAYHADPCTHPSVSSGIISTIVNETLADARWKHPRLNLDLEPEDSTKYDLGSVAHELLLGKGSGIVVIDADDWRKKDSQEERDAAIKAGKQPCLRKIHDKAVAMVAAAREQIEHDPDNRLAFVEGVPEQVAICLHETPVGPIYCRTMMDWRMMSVPAIYDYKTYAPGPDPDDFARYLFREARDVQDPFYSYVLAQVLGIDWREVTFRYVVQNPAPPYVVSVIELDEQARAFAFERAMWALDRWALANKDGRFEGYRPRTHYVAAPPYEMIRWAEKRAADEFADALDDRAAA